MDNSHLNDLDLDAFAQALADAAESRGLLQAPANLKESILERSHQPDMVLQAQSNRLSRKLTLLGYGLRVAAAAAASVAFILMVPAADSGFQREELKQQALEDISDLTRHQTAVPVYRRIQDAFGVLSRDSIFNLEEWIDDK